MDPQAFINSADAAALPAPFWFIQFFKVLGFTLHLVPMNIWYAGTIISMMLWTRQQEHGRRLASRLMTQMPIIIAMGVNFGIVPLLFIQVAYSKFFYPATILMAWFWFSVFGLLIVAYYGVYLYAFGLKDNARAMTPLRRTAGWAAAFAFLILGFIFANAMSLLSNVTAWPELWQNHQVAGAATGTALNVADPSLWPRWLMLFGLAVTTAAAWVGFDSAWFAAADSADYRRWARGFAWKLHAVGMIWFAAAGSLYVFGTWEESVRERMLHSPMLAHTLLTGAAPGAVWLLLLLLSRQDADRGRPLAALVGLAQVGVLGINAVSRQIVQNIEIEPFSKGLWANVATQWSPLIVFLVLFVAGLGVVAWMIAQVAKLPSEATP